jgi:hypothetical protein
VRNHWTHASTGRDSPLIRANSSQVIEEIVRIVLGFDITQGLVNLAIKCCLEVRLAEVGLEDISQYSIFE